MIHEAALFDTWQIWERGELRRATDQAGKSVEKWIRKEKGIKAILCSEFYKYQLANMNYIFATYILVIHFYREF